MRRDTPTESAKEQRGHSSRAAVQKQGVDLIFAWNKCLQHPLYLCAALPLTVCKQITPENTEHGP